jgi:aminomethyltransferase
MKNTSLTFVHQKLGAKMVPFAGYNMPVEYSGVINEHLAVRNGVGVFDVSHMGEFWVKGEGALALLQKITTNDVSLLNIGQAQYSCMPNGKGGIVDDLIIYRFEELKYFVVVNASNIQKDWDWMNRQNVFNAELEDASERMSLIALQGPKAQEVLQKLTEVKLDTLKSFHFTTTAVAGAENVIVSATGYTGAGGFELYFQNSDAIKIWEALMDAGKSFGIVAAGLAARDTLRLEKGYSLYGNDIDDTTSPIEAGLGWIVKFSDNKDFIDKDFLFKQKSTGVEKKMVGILLIGRGIPRHGYPLVDENETMIGEITSGTMSPVLKKGIGMAYVKTDFSQIGTKVFLKIRNKMIEAEVVKLPFV